MKKQLQLSIISAAVLLVASTAGFAAGNYKGENYKGEAMPAPCPQPEKLGDGFYVGAQVGYDTYTNRQNTTANVIGLGSSNTNPSIGAPGWVGGLFGGYGQYFQNVYYLGGEIFVNDSNASETTNTSALSLSTSSKFTVGTSYGISLLPGYKVNNTSLLYVRLGYNRARLKTQGTASAPGFSVSSSDTNWSNGFNYGLGMETLVYQNFSVRGEYTHTGYSSFSASGSNAAGSASTKASPSDNQFMLGLIYHFA